MIARRLRLALVAAMAAGFLSLVALAGVAPIAGVAPAARAAPAEQPIGPAGARVLPAAPP